MYTLHIFVIDGAVALAARFVNSGARFIGHWRIVLAVAVRAHGRFQVTFFQCLAVDAVEGIAEFGLVAALANVILVQGVLAGAYFFHRKMGKFIILVAVGTLQFIPLIVAPCTEACKSCPSIVTEISSPPAKVIVDPAGCDRRGSRYHPTSLVAKRPD